MRKPTLQRQPNQWPRNRSVSWLPATFRHLDRPGKRHKLLLMTCERDAGTTTITPPKVTLPGVPFKSLSSCVVGWETGALYLSQRSRSRPVVYDKHLRVHTSPRVHISDMETRAYSNGVSTKQQSRPPTDIPQSSPAGARDLKAVRCCTLPTCRGHRARQRKLRPRLPSAAARSSAVHCLEMSTPTLPVPRKE